MGGGVAGSSRRRFVISRDRLFAAPWTVARQAPFSMGILQARILEWVAISFLECYLLEYCLLESCHFFTRMFYYFVGI